MRALAMVAVCFSLAHSAWAVTGVELPKGADVPLVVEVLQNDSYSIELSEEAIRKKVESQMRRNGVQPESESNTSARGYYVYIGVGVTGRSFTTRVIFKRRVSYAVSGRQHSMFATTYEDFGRGNHGRDYGYLIDHLLRDVDTLCEAIKKSWE